MGFFLSFRFVSFSFLSFPFLSLFFFFLKVRMKRCRGVEDAFVYLP